MKAPLHPLDRDPLPLGSPTGRRSQRGVIMWGLALAILVSTALFCWLVVIPVSRAQDAVKCYMDLKQVGKPASGPWSLPGVPPPPTLSGLTDEDIAGTVVDLHGGAAEVTYSLRLYLLFPGITQEEREAARSLLKYCERCRGAVPSRRK